MKDKRRRPWLSVIIGGESLVSHAGGVLLVEAAQRSGLAKELVRRLGPWRRPLAVHDPGKIVLDLPGTNRSLAKHYSSACNAFLTPTRAAVPVNASTPTISKDWPGAVGVSTVHDHARTGQRRHLLLLLVPRESAETVRSFVCARRCHGASH